MNEKPMSNPTFVVEQLEEALEERSGSDRRKRNVGSDPDTGSDRRGADRRTGAATE